MQTNEQYEVRNFFHEVQGFRNRRLTNSLTPDARHLWLSLLIIANLSMWKKDLTMSIATLEQETGMKKQAILKARNLLVQKGFLNVKHGKGNQSATYSLISQIQRPPAARSQPQSYPQADTQAYTQADTQATAQWDTDNIIINKKQDKTEQERSRTKRTACFTPPSPEEVKEYCSERGNSIDPVRFVDYYTACGWCMGSTPIKDWRAAVRIWESRERSDAGTAHKAKPFESSFDTDDFFEAAVARALADCPVD